MQMHNAGMICGYARVSTGAQDLTSQLAQLNAVGCEKMYREKITSMTADRPQLRKRQSGNDFWALTADFKASDVRCSKISTSRFAFWFFCLQ